MRHILLATIVTITALFAAGASGPSRPLVDDFEEDAFGPGGCPCQQPRCWPWC